MSSFDQQLFKEIIQDHYKNPHNKGLKNDPDYVTVHFKNPSCGDDLTIQVKVDGEKIVDIRHQGSGCAICCSSASVMSVLLKAKTVMDALAIIKEFKLMVSAEPFNEELLDEAVAFQGVAQLPPRIKCATLAWLACEEGLENYHEKE